MKKRSKREITRMVQAACLPCAGLVTALLWSTAVAGPQNPTIQHGNVTITDLGGGVFEIHQQSNSAIVNYSSFNLNMSQLAQFLQPGQNSAILNRITNGQITSIDGTINANGQVFFVNPAGIVFGNNAVINAHGFHAIGGDIDDQNFIDFYDHGTVNSLNFTNLQGDVINHGMLQASEIVNLAGRRVANHGVIDVSGMNGVLAMTAADGTVTIQPNNGYLVTFSNNAGPGSIDGFGVSNTGTLNAQNGSIQLGAGDVYSLAAVHLKNDGVAAQSLTVDGAVKLGSDVTLDVQDALFSSTIDSLDSSEHFALTLTGDVAFMNDLGSNSELKKLSVAGATDLLGNVTTIGEQEYLGAVVIGSDTVLTGSDIVFGSKVNSGPLAAAGQFFDLDINGNATFFGNVGDVKRLGTLTVNGLSYIYGGDIFTDNDQIYNGAVWLLADTKMTTQSPGGVVVFGDILNTGFAAMPGTYFNLDLFSDVEFHGQVGGLRALNSLVVDGGTIINTDLIRTRNIQDYGREVRLLTDATLESQLGGTLRFGSTIDGSYALTLKTSGLTEFNGQIGMTAALESLTTEGGGIVLINTDLVRTMNDQNYGDQVWIAENALIDLLNAGATATFGMTVDSSPLNAQDHFSLSISQNAQFMDQVGGEKSLQSLQVDGNVLLGTDLIQTVDSQTYLGMMTLTENALLQSEQGGDLNMNAIVGPFELVLDTSGVTSLNGAIGEGAGNELASLSITGNGQTVIDNSSINTTGDQNFSEATQLLSAGTFNAGGDVNFDSTLNANGHDLTINALNVRFLDQVTGLGALNTSGGGEILLGSDLETSGGMNIGHDIILLTDVSLTDHGTNGINLMQTINSEAGQSHSLTVAALNGNVAFGQNIGELNPLGSLEIASGGTIVFSSELVQTVGDILLNTSVTTVGVPAVATIGVNGDITFTSLEGDFTMGQNQKMSAVGSIDVNADTATLGDISTLGDLTVNANSILLLTREPSTVLNADGSTSTDFGLDFVAGGQFFFSVVPVLLGDGVAVFSSPNSQPDANGTLGNFLQLLRAAEITEGDLRLGNPTFFDLAASGTALTDLAEALAELIEEADDGEVLSDVTLGPIDLDRLLEVGVQGRLLTQAELQDFAQGRGLYLDAPGTAVLAEAVTGASVNVERVDRRAVERTLATYEGLRFDPAADDPAATDRSGQIRSTLGATWQQYAGDTDAPAGDGYVQHLLDTGAEESLLVLNQLRQLERDMTALGLTRAERRRAMEIAVADFLPEGMAAGELIDAVRSLPQ